MSNRPDLAIKALEKRVLRADAARTNFRVQARALARLNWIFPNNQSRVVKG
jgi:hypothetical protein